jgi:polyhydroxybutyrate depolymerase
VQQLRLGVVAALGVVLCLVAGCGAAHDSAAPSSRSTTTAPHAGTTASTAPTRSARTSDGCGKAPAVGATDDPTGDVPLDFDSAGQARTYRLGVPKSYDPDTPAGVILNLHGSGSNAVQQSVYSQVPARGTKRGYIVVTPDAIDGVWQRDNHGTDDQFLMALLDHIEADYCVDLDHVHADGISLGSWKASITACTHRDRIASIVLVAEEVSAGCAIPVVAFHGTADPVVPYGEGADAGVVVTGSNAGLPGAIVNMANWAKNAGCATEKDVQRIDPDVEHWTYRECPGGNDVEFYKIQGGGHTWPGAAIDIPLGPTTKTIDATDIALDWFDAHPLRD